MATTEDVLRYTSDSHAKTLLRGLYRLRLTHELHDVWLCIGSERFAAHKIVLAASSEYFDAMFLGGLAEADKDRVEIHGITPDIFKILLEFIYTGEIIWLPSGIDNVDPVCVVIRGTGDNGDESGTATTKTATRQNGDNPKRRQQWSKQRQLEPKRRQPLVKTATVIGQNGDSSQSTAKKFGRSKRRQ